MGMATFVSGDTVFERLLGEISYPMDSDPGKLYPFRVRCGVVKDRPPRHEFFEYLVDIGRMDIERVLMHKPLNCPHLAFVFPERWMSVREQVQFMAKLMTHPNMEKIESLDLLTSSPMLIGHFMAQQVRILTWPEEDKGYRYA